MNSVYVCNNGMWHDKPCRNGEPSSNNGWIYSAYAHHLNLITSPNQYAILSNIYGMCLVLDHPLYWIQRLPSKMFPPISRDEIIGMVILKVLPYSKLKRQKFLMVKDGMLTTSFKKIFKALWSLKGKHRNYAWENKIYNAYPVVFRLFGHDRYFIKRTYQVSPDTSETIQFYLYMIGVLHSKKPGELNLLWVQLKDLNSKYWIKLIDIKKSMNEYFGKDHHFARVVSGS